MTPLLTPKIKIWKKCKKTWTYYPSYACVPKWRSYDVWLLRYKGTTDSLLTFFALLNKKSIFKKNEKNAWRYYHFTQVYQKSWSYAMLYCSWGMTRDGLLFFILSYFFCPFTLLPLTVRKIKIKKKCEKKTWTCHHFTQVYQKSWSYAILFLRYGAWWMQLLFFTLDYFLPFYTP